MVLPLYTPNQDFYGADSLTYKTYDDDIVNQKNSSICKQKGDWPFIPKSSDFNKPLGGITLMWKMTCMIMINVSLIL